MIAVGVALMAIWKILLPLQLATTATATLGAFFTITSFHAVEDSHYFIKAAGLCGSPFNQVPALTDT